MAQITGVNNVVNEIEQTVAKVHLSLTDNIINILKKETPVDTGAARRGWRSSENSAAGEFSVAALSGSLESSGDQSDSFTQELQAGANKAFIETIIFNTEPYVMTGEDWGLNWGSSTQAPKGFVEMAVLDAVARAR